MLSGPKIVKELLTTFQHFKNNFKIIINKKMIQKFLLLFLSVTLQSDKGLEGDLLRPSNYVLLSKDIFVQLIYRRKNAKSSVLSNFNRISFQ